MIRNAKPMGDAPKKKTGKATVRATTGKGRPKQPIEKREKLSTRPHKGRISPPDIPTGTAIDPGLIPEKPPIPLGKYERECWDRIVKSQRAMEVGAWLFRSDCEFLLALCVQYGRLRQVRSEIDEAVSQGLPFVDPETGKANPLLAIEKSLSAAYQTGLKELAMVPSRRQITANIDNDGADESDVDWIA